MSPRSHTYQQPPVSPVNIVDGARHSIPQFPVIHSTSVGEKTKEVTATTRVIRSDSDSSTSSVNLTSPRKARFAEATSVYSPATGPGEHQNPFANPSQLARMTARPSDIGFGYISDNQPVEQHATIPAATVYSKDGAPLKSAMKTPGTARFVDPRSPTFREETVLEKEEEKTEVSQAKDLKIKTRVRMAKMVLRGVSFSCSLIVLSMVSTTFMIFNATKSLPSRNGLPAWAPGVNPWPQIIVLTIACVSLLLSIVVMAAYCRGGHRRAEKVAFYYTVFAMSSFVFSIIMWLVGATVLQGTKINSGGQDIWGWSCKDNKRRELFQDQIHYALVCRLQDWSLVCCIIEIVIEMIVIAIYGVVFYRFYTKNKLRKSMNARDKARSDLYLAQLRSQSAPNTPGFNQPQTPRTPRFITPMSEMKEDPHSAAENGYAPSYTPTSATPFKLAAAPARKTPKAVPAEFSPHPQSPVVDKTHEHVAAAPGEQVYDAVPIPGQYEPVARQY